jgi:hypothetical protein
LRTLSLAHEREAPRPPALGPAHAWRGRWGCRIRRRAPSAGAAGRRSGRRWRRGRGRIRRWPGELEGGQPPAAARACSSAAAAAGERSCLASGRRDLGGADAGGRRQRVGAGLIDRDRELVREPGGGSGPVFGAERKAAHHDRFELGRDRGELRRRDRGVPLVSGQGTACRPVSVASTSPVRSGRPDVTDRGPIVASRFQGAPARTHSGFDSTKRSVCPACSVCS